MDGILYRGTVTMPNGKMMTEHGRADLYTTAEPKGQYSMRVLEHETFAEACAELGYPEDVIRSAQAECVWCTRVA